MASAQAQVTGTSKHQQRNDVDALVRNKVFKKLFESFLGEGKGQLKIMVVGEAGQGKSTLINGLIGANAKEGHSLEAGTSEVKEYCKEQNGITIRIWDTPGFGLGKKEDDDIRIEQDLKSSSCYPPDLLLFCLKMDTTRIPTRVHEDTIQKLTEVFGDKIWHHAMFVLTFANRYVASLKDDGKDIKKCFLEQQNLIKKELYTVLRQHSGLTDEQVQHVRVVPVGNYKKTRGYKTNQWALPDREDWYLNFWCECYNCMDMKGFTKITRVNRHRVRTGPEPEDNVQQYIPQDRLTRVSCVKVQEANIQENISLEPLHQHEINTAFQQNSTANDNSDLDFPLYDILKWKLEEKDSGLFKYIETFVSEYTKQDECDGIVKSAVVGFFDACKAYFSQFSD